MIKRFLTICALALCANVSFVVANDVTDVVESNKAPIMSARFLPDSVGIGDHVTLSIDVEQDVMQVVAFPDFNRVEGSTLELVGVPTLDTLAVEGRRVKLSRRYTFTSFDEGYYNVGRVAVLYADKGGVDTLYTPDSVRLFVGTYIIDSTSHSIFDLKPIRELPFKFREISGYTTWVILGLILLLILIYVGLRLMAHFGRPVLGLFKPAPPVPPHVAAIEALQTLRGERLWQEGEYKGYYSRLTDIVRTYISGRYGVAAMEMTTDEILSSIRELDIPTQCAMELREMLRDADLVKFAKAEFSGSQNERYFESAVVFVKLTKEVDEEAEESEEAEQSEAKEESSDNKNE